MTINTQKLRAFRQSLQRCASNTGHGHVYMRPDGFLAKCGGPGICTECAKDLALLMAHDGYEPPTTDDLIDTIDAQAAEIARLRVENDGLNAQLDRHTSYTIVHRGAALYCTSAMLDTYSDERARADAAEAEIARLREALGSIRQYGNDTLSGRADGGPDDRKWQREAVIEMRNRARAALQEKSNVPTV